MSESVEVVDGRRFPFYMIDNDLIGIYGSRIGAYGVAVYNVLAYYANRRDEAWPSYQTIADRIAIGRSTALRTIDLLVEVGLIQKCERQSGAGDRTSNLYTLVDLHPEAAGHALLAEAVRAPGGGSPQTPPSVPAAPGGGATQTPRGVPQTPEQESVNKNQSEQEAFLTGAAIAAAAGPSAVLSLGQRYQEYIAKCAGQKPNITGPLLHEAYVFVHGGFGGTIPAVSYFCLWAKKYQPGRCLEAIFDTATRTFTDDPFRYIDKMLSSKAKKAANFGLGALPPEVKYEDKDHRTYEERLSGTQREGREWTKMVMDAGRLCDSADHATDPAEAAELERAGRDLYHQADRQFPQWAGKGRRVKDTMPGGRFANDPAVLALR